MDNKNFSTRERLLKICNYLNEGKTLNKNEAAAYFGVSLRSIQRDIDELRSYFHNQSEKDGLIQEIVYDKRQNGYYLQPPSRQLLSNQEILAVLKILLDSRGLIKKELYPILDKLINSCVPRSEQKQVNEIIGNEKYYYTEPQHQKAILKNMWLLAEAVDKQKIVFLNYCRMDGKMVQRKIEPVGIMFSEFYFYLTAFIAKDSRDNLHYEVENDPYPTIYRIDRIQNFTVTDEYFKVPYQNRFEEGLFRKRIQFMQGGKLQRVKFLYKGPSVEAVLDRLPTSVILKHDKSGYFIKAEVFGKGIEMWLRSQGSYVGNVEFE